MNAKLRVVALAIGLLPMVMAVSAASADSTRPECDRTDSENLCQANITVFVFVDGLAQGRCDTFYESGTDFPIEGARITFIMPDDSRVQRTTGQTGLLSFPSVDFLAGDEAFIEVEYPARYRDAVLVPCASSPPIRRLTRDSFGAFGATQVVFCASRHRPPASNTVVQ